MTDADVGMPRRPEAKLLAENVTIVVSVKDQFGRTRDQLQEIYDTVPEVPILYVMSGPMHSETEKFLKEEETHRPGFQLLDSGLGFANPYVLRNLAIPHVRTKYVMFLFNDIMPVNKEWLAELYRCAEQKKEADIFQPFIWEGALTHPKSN